MNYLLNLTFSVLFFFLSGCQLRTHQEMKGPIIDLTYPFNDQTIYWPTEEDFQLEKEFYGMTKKGYFYSSNKMKVAEHGGTHVDAPIHFSQQGKTVDQIPLQQLMGVGITIDVQNQSQLNRDYQVAIDDFLQWEKIHGPIPQGAILLLRTGFGKFYQDRQKYLGTKEKGRAAVKDLHFPGLLPQAALWLAKERKISAVGLDTPSIDHGPSQLFESHQHLCQYNIPIFENVAHLDQLPAKGFWVVALPMKIEKGSGGPLRIVALLNFPLQ